MAQKTKRTAKLANTFGVFGYLSLCFQWLWSAAILLPPLLENPSVRNFLLPEQGQAAPVATPLDTALSPLFLLASILITVTLLLVSIIILIRLPVAIAKTGKKSIQTTAEAILPVVTHQQKITPKKRRLLTAKLVKLIKLIFCILPVALLLVLHRQADTQIPQELMIFIAAIFAVASLVWFSLQYITARWMKTPDEQLL